MTHNGDDLSHHHRPSCDLRQKKGMYAAGGRAQPGSWRLNRFGARTRDYKTEKGADEEWLQHPGCSSRLRTPERK
jgi:hypothetical protein